MKYTREFWGEWKKMDQSETWLISSTSIKVNGVELSKDVILAKPSQNVISVTDNGNTYCLYAIRTASSSITGSVLTGDTSRDITAGWLSVVVQNINDIYDVVETTTDADGNFEAENLISGEDYNIKIGDTSLNVRPSFDGEDIGNITLKSGVNFKVTLSNANDLMYAGSQYYSMNLIIENIGDTNCTAATYSLVGDEGIEVINNYADGVLLRTVAAGEKKVIPLRVRCDIPEAETAVRKLNLAITDKDGTVWNDSVSLKFYRDNVTINVVSENGRPISGVIIGDGRTYSITNSTNYSIQIPVTAESYLLVFSGAIANATRNTEAAYSVGVNKPAIAASDLLAELGTGTNSYEPNDDENHARSITFGKAIVSYLFENDIDYYYLEPLHLWDEGVVTKPATCTEDGSITYTCKVCGDTTEGIIPATGHSFDSEWIKDADYHWHAAICGHDVISEKLQHTWNEGTVLIEPTHTQEGQKLLTCTACGQTKTESIPIVSYSIGDIGPAGGYVFYDCDADNDTGNADGLISTECGWRYLEAAPADLRIVNGLPTIDSSTSDYSDADSGYIFGYLRTSDDGSNSFVNGTTTYDSSNCTRPEIGAGLFNTQLLVNVSHYLLNDEVYSSIIGSSKTGDYAASLCDRLTYTVDEISFTDWFLPSKDELILMYSNLKANGLGGFADAYYWSSYEGANTTTGVWGMNFQHQSKSEYKRYAEFNVRPIRAFLQNEPQGHAYETRVSKEPTCTDSGLIIYTCKNCGHSFEERISALGHSFSSDWAKDDDYHWHVASCGHDMIEGKAAHTWNDGVRTTEPTHTTEGVMTYTCSTCGQTKTESIPMESYLIGDIGPAGGYIFYDCDADNDSGNADGLKSTECGWRYLEAAPADLRVVNGTPTVDSSLYGYSIAPARYRFGWYRIEDGIGLYVNGTTEYSPLNCTREEIGTGERNTRLLVLAMGDEPYSSESGSEKLANYPAKLCYDLVHTVNGVSYSNWFLPSKDELNLMYENLRLAGLGNFVNYGTYYENWSSSEFDEGGAFYQNFDEGGQYGGNRADDYDQIRPIRAFLQNEQQGHVYEIEISKEPTCTDSGLAVYTCKNCGRSFEERIPALGHSFSSDWSKDADYHWHASTCGHDVIEGKVAHTWNEGVRTTEPTHTEEGVMTYTCTVCGQTKTESIAALVDAHTFSDEWAKDGLHHWHESTCGHDITNGESEHIFSSSHMVERYGVEFKYDVCEVCGYEQLDASDYIPLLKIEPYNSGREWIIKGVYDINSIPEVLAIPYQIEGKKVTTIEMDAFIICYNLETIIIPSSINLIKDGVFIGCDNLKNIVFDDNQFYYFEDGMILNKAGTEIVSCPNASISVIPNTITSIYSHAFYDNENILDISFEDGTNLNSIGDSAFRSSSIRSISIPDSVVSLGTHAFQGCENLISITIPSSVLSIGKAPFYGCHDLVIEVSSSNPNYSSQDGALFNKDKTILIDHPSATGAYEVPNTVKTIAWYAFYTNTSITSITIPISVEMIESRALSCKNLTDIYYAGTIEQWNSIDKAQYWKGGSEAIDVTVHCSDGVIVQ